MAETNGIAEIRVNGNVHQLLFGRAAVQEMSDRSITNLSSNGTKLLTDLIYSGLMNHNIKFDLPRVEYSDVYDLVEQFADEEDASDQEKKLWETFEASRWGSQWVDELNKIKKKVETMTENIPL